VLNRANNPAGLMIGGHIYWGCGKGAGCCLTFLRFGVRYEYAKVWYSGFKKKAKCCGNVPCPAADWSLMPPGVLLQPGMPPKHWSRLLLWQDPGRLVGHPAEPGEHSDVPHLTAWPTSRTYPPANIGTPTLAYGGTETDLQAFWWKCCTCLLCSH